MAQMRMEIKKCGKGHFYSSEYEQCPFCSGNVDKGTDAPEWEMDPEVKPEKVPQKPAEPVIEKKPTPEGPWVKSAVVEKYGDTEPDWFPGKDTMGCDPVVGWLVCIQGPNRGQAYRLHSGTNFIGRGKQSDVCIDGDMSISNKNHASVSYDERERVFYITKGEVRNPTYLNGKALRSDADLVIYDHIEIGNTELVFVPLCGDQFNWQDF